MNDHRTPRHALTAEDTRLLQELRRKHRAHHKPAAATTIGDRVSDKVAEIVGSWRFIIIQSALLLLWIALNLLAWIQAWDPYPFILLNLVLSFQAAFTAPIIMMSQNRQAAIDRKEAEHDYHINLKAELEIELLHEKMDLLREQELKELITIIRDLERRIPPASAEAPPRNNS